MTVEEIMKGLLQIQSNSYDGALTVDGLPLKIGMKREEIMSNHERRMDAFSVHFVSPDKICVKYSRQIRLSDVKDKKFEDDVYGTITDVVSHLKSEFKKLTKKSVSLKEVERHAIDIQYVSSVNTYITASILYTIGSIDKADSEVFEPKKHLDKMLKQFSKINEPAKPKNVTRKAEKQEAKA